MRRRVLVPLIVGWLLGLLTAFVWPAVSTERETVVVMIPAGHGGGANSPEAVAGRTRNGWVVTRVDTIGQGASAVQLERNRPLHARVFFALRQPRGSWWCMLTTGDWSC